MTARAGSVLPELSGILGACLTPFAADGSVDQALLEAEIDFLVSHVDAISLAAVEAAEYTPLAPEARVELIRRGAAMVAKRLPLIVGASSPSLDVLARLAELAAEVEADYVQVLIPLRPWGGQPSTDESVDYFGRITARSPLPIVVYHNPGPGADPPPAAMVQLSELENIVAFKESSRDITKIAALIEQIDRAGKARYFTTMQPLLATLLMGGSGGTMPPPGTLIGARVLAAFRSGDLDTAVRWQRVFSTFPGHWAKYGLPPVMKAAMRSLGVDLGDPLPPYRAVTPEAEKEIAEFLGEAGVPPLLSQPS